MKKRDFTIDGKKYSIVQVRPIPHSNKNIRCIVSLVFDDYIEINLKVIRHPLCRRSYVDWPRYTFYDGHKNNSVPNFFFPKDVSEEIDSFILNECENQGVL